MTNVKSEVYVSNMWYVVLCLSRIKRHVSFMSSQNLLITNLELQSKPGHVLDNIPQLDGVELVKDTFKCENCQLLFATPQLLDNHVQEYDYVCDECSLCFKGQYHYDLHEHAEHPEDYFKFNQVSPNTKLQLTRRLASAVP